jgi:hypothetical protein
LRTFRGAGGVAWPSHATLADRAKCCTRTVQRALAQAQGLGLVSWVERCVRAGWRWLQTSNLYTFTTPAGPVQAGMRAPRTARAALTDIRAGEGRESKKEALEELLRAAQAAPDLLLRRRLVIEGAAERSAFP